MFDIMSKLIVSGYYSYSEDAMRIVDVFLARGRITASEYTSLCTLIDEHCSPIPPEPEADVNDYEESLETLGMEVNND